MDSAQKTPHNHIYPIRLGVMLVYGGVRGRGSLAEQIAYSPWVVLIEHKPAGFCLSDDL